MKNLYFCLGLVGVIILAKLSPSFGNKGGLLKPEITSKYVAVFFLFLINGLTLPTETLKAALFRFDVHILIQGFTFILFPAFMYALVTLLRYSSLHPALLQGMMILSTMPPPVSSAIFLTKAVGGNVAAALFNSAFGSMLGIFITPSLILLLFGGSEVDIPTEQIFYQLLVTVVVPLLMGQIFRAYRLQLLNRLKIPFNELGQFLIFYIIYTTFCATFSREITGIDTFSLLLTIFLMLAILIAVQIFLMWFSYSILSYTAGDCICIIFTGSHKNIAIVLILQISIMIFLAFISSSSIFQFDSPDLAAIVYCGTHKSITLGIPVIDIIFEGNQNISFLSIPLLIYNPLQILFGGMTVGVFQNWLNTHKRKSLLPTHRSLV